VEAHRLRFAVIALAHQRQLLHVEAGLPQGSDRRFGGGVGVEDKEGGVWMAHDLLAIQ
jgi:hypothetical protein